MRIFIVFLSFLFFGACGIGIAVLGGRGQPGRIVRFFFVICGFDLRLRPNIHVCSLGSFRLILSFSFRNIFF